MSSNAPVIILTGASRGLGLAILRILLEKYGANVTTLSRTTPPEYTDVVEKYGSERILTVQGDICDVEVNERTVKQTVEKWGRLDGVILNAGQLEPVGKIADLPLSALPSYVQTNLLSLFYLIQPSLAHLRRKTDSEPGRIVCVSSGASSTGYQAWGLYSMVKAGMNSLVRTLHSEESGNGVFSYAVRPGVIDTSMQAYIRENGKAHMSEKDMTKFIGAHEKGELLSPEQPGAIIAALAVRGTKELSGEYINWADERLANIL